MLDYIQCDEIDCKYNQTFCQCPVVEIIDHICVSYEPITDDKEIKHETEN